MAKKKRIINIIRDTPSDMMEDISLQNNIIQHVNAFGFGDVVGNIIEAYRNQARRFNKQAKELEKVFQTAMEKESDK